MDVLWKPAFGFRAAYTLNWHAMRTWILRTVEAPQCHSALTAQDYHILSAS